MRKSKPPAITFEMARRACSGLSIFVLQENKGFAALYFEDTEHPHRYRQTWLK